MSRDRLVLNVSLDYLANRGTVLMKRTAAQQIADELMLTPEERAEAIEMADDMEIYFAPVRD
jgi:hypothetical protein